MMSGEDRQEPSAEHIPLVRGRVGSSRALQPNGIHEQHLSIRAL